MTTSTEVLEELTRLRDRLAGEFSAPEQLLDPGLKTDLESRRESESRQMEHLHQLCFMHCRHIEAVNSIKLLQVVDIYLEMSRGGYALGVYMAARMMLELSAFLHEVRGRLIEAVELARSRWKDGGLKFFGYVMRARYGTNSRAEKERLSGEVSKNNLKPYNVTDCLDGLAAREGLDDVMVRYEVLCDFVHHNFGSGSTSKAGWYMSNVAQTRAGEIVFAPDSIPVIQYEYPLPKQATLAINETALNFLNDALACQRWISELPSTPFSPDLLRKVTGSELGFTNLMPTRPVAEHENVGRNDPCPCGSGKKYKRCCLDR